jgi:hypothetical protein
MPKEIIFALVLAAVFLGAIAWLVVYSRLQYRKIVKAEQQQPAVRPEAARVRSDASTGARRVVTR